MKKTVICLAILTVMIVMGSCGDVDSSSGASSAKTAASSEAVSSKTEASSSGSASSESKVEPTESTSSVSETEPSESNTVTTPDTPEPEVEPTNEAVSIDAIVGIWIYENYDASSEEYVGVPKGYVIVSENGEYTFEDGSSTVSGTVKVDYWATGDDTKEPFYAFCNAEGEIWIGCFAVPGQTDVFNIGQDGGSRLVRDNGNAAGGTDNFSVPNEYGFYEEKDPPATSISVAALSGTWSHADNTNETLSITKGSDIYNGNFTFTGADGSSVTGYIKLEYTLDNDNTAQSWYTFYDNNGKLWNAFVVSGDIPLDDLYTEQQTHFSRVS